MNKKTKGLLRLIRKLKNIILKPAQQILQFFYLFEQREQSILDINRILKHRYDCENDYISVGFIKQLDSVWEKSASIYERMVQDSRFTVYLLEVENTDASVNDLTKNKKESKVYKGGKLIGNLDEEMFSELYLDYIFYGRPYDGYLPNFLRSKHVRKKALICYISYYYRYSFELGILNQQFIDNTYLYFVESKEIEQFEINKQKRTISKGSKKIKCCGYPVFDNILYSKNNEILIKQKPCILWAPRWSTDKYLGGSNFFNYKDFFLSDDFLNLYNLIIRPHPLMLGNFVRSKEMTEQDVLAFREDCHERNVAIDENPSYISSLMVSHAMVSDVSSMLVEYMVTSKPVIVCKTDAKIWKILSNSIRSCLYEASNQDEIKQALSMALNDDPLFEIRKSYIKNNMLLGSGSSADKIVDSIVEDWQSNRKLRL